MSYILSVKEQTPTRTSILCEVSLDNSSGHGLIYRGSMYFVCDLNKRITQYFDWMTESKYKKAILKLGYKFT